MSLITCHRAPPVFRLYSDAGEEFTGGAFQKAVEQGCVGSTVSAQQNVRAKRLVGLLKSAAGFLLLHAQYPLQLWSEAILEATFLRRCKKLKLLIPKHRPHMRDVILGRKPPSALDHRFEPRAQDGVFLARRRVERGPQDQTVWVSTTGDVGWNAPTSHMITVEESVREIQPWNNGNTAVEIIKEREMVN